MSVFCLGTFTPLVYITWTSPPGNVLLTQSFKAKLADFGIAKGDKEIAMGKATVTSGTNEFMPPEAFPSDRSRQKHDFNYYTDSFSFGCLMLFMLTHMWPHHS